MENVEEKNEQQVKVKKDFHPIWIYIVGQVVAIFIASFIMGMLAAQNGVTDFTDITKLQEFSGESTGIASIVVFTILSIVFIIMYRKRIKEGLKALDKKKVIFILVTTLILFVANFIITQILVKLNVPLTNQNAIEGAVDSFTIPMILLTTIFIPFIEEIVFRYSLGSLIKNNVVFVIVSSVLFGFMHCIGSLNLALVLYIFMGAIFSLIYIKTDRNFMSSTIAHIINNSLAIVLSLIFSNL